MSERQAFVPPTPNRISVDPSLTSSSIDSSSSLWDRISTWAAEHKAVVYTLAGATIVATGAGIYYYTSSPKPSDAATGKKKAKKDKRKAKKDAEEGETTEQARQGINLPKYRHAEDSDPN